MSRKVLSVLAVLFCAVFVLTVVPVYAAAPAEVCVYKLYCRSGLEFDVYADAKGKVCSVVIDSGRRCPEVWACRWQVASVYGVRDNAVFACRVLANDANMYVVLNGFVLDPCSPRGQVCVAGWMGCARFFFRTEVCGVWCA